jgi:hypothetical protein
MSWTVLSGIGSKIGTAAAVGALVAVSALSVPARAFAAPPQPDDPDCPTDVAVNPACQFDAPNVPTNPDDPRCVGSPLSVGCEGGPFDEDPIDNEWLRLPDEPIG